MMPNLGQGGCQAIEDAFAITDELCDVTDKSQIPDALERYYKRRLVRSAIVQGMSRLSSDIIISSFTTPFRLDEFLAGNTKHLSLPALLTNYLQFFLPSIFYAQFGYLYSFTPAGFEPEKIKQMVEKSIARNKREVSKVYENLKDGYVTYFTAKTMSFMHFNKKTREMSKIGDAKDFRI